MPQVPPSIQKLNPKQARFCLGVAGFVEKELGLVLSGTRILTAFSGGADSTALLLCLFYLAPVKKFSLHAAHLDHALRPTSVKEKEWCDNLCRRLGIPFASKRLDIQALSRESKTGVEECARNSRYGFLSTVADTEGCDWIAAGHTQNDLAEDVLMRLLRGAGWPGLGGMTGLDANRRIVRPLLMTPRADIEGFLRSLGMNWLEDESNADHAYTRNRIRADILPLLFKENPGFLKSVAAVWRIARIDEGYFTDAVSCIRSSGSNGDAGQDIRIPMEEIAPLPKALRIRLYKTILASLGSGQALSGSILRLDDTLMDMAGGKAREGTRLHQFPGGKTAVVSRKGIIWKKI